MSEEFIRSNKDIFCFKCKKHTKTVDTSQIISKSNKLMMKGLCEDCNTTKCKFIPTESSTPRSEGLNTLKTGNGIPEQSKDIKEKDKILRQSTSESERDLLEKTYYSPFSGFCGINELARKTKKSPKVQDVYTLHKPARKNFKSQRVYFNGIDDQWQSDLVEMIPYSKENNDYKYLLTIIDCFSKFAWVSKTGKETADSKRKPKKMQTDNGKEYYNKEMNKLFTSLEINHFSTYSDKKASIVERFNRTLKEKMWKMFTHQGNHKWTNILDDLVKGYNNHYHSSIKMTPIEASKIENEGIVYSNLFPKVDPEDLGIKDSVEKIEKEINTKFKIGDTIRITKYKAIFDKGYLPNWSTEQFKISEVHPGDPTMYSIKDLADEEIKGKFYEEELTPYNNNVTQEYKIEKVLKKRNRKENGKILKEMFVKWYGYPDKFNSWIAETDLKT
uniref:Integrase catalytic domain-containing protein n=1 Tax=Heterorhabditis bacteriophora TaxID=37862 RepID=A0A1I7WFC1_HETBA